MIVERVAAMHDRTDCKLAAMSAVVPALDLSMYQAPDRAVFALF